MIRRVCKDLVPLVGRAAQSIRCFTRAGSTLWLALLLMTLAGCGKVVDLAAERHAKAVKALIDLGAEVKDVEDEVTHDRGTYVILYREHFSPDGRLHNDVLTLIREIQVLFLGVINTPVTDDAMPDLARLPNLRVLNATVTRLTDRGLKLIATSRDIRLLKLNRTLITDEGLDALREMPSLRLIYLGETRLTNEALPQLAKMPQLEAIKLTSLPIDDEGLKAIADMPRLRFLALDGTAITDAGLPHLDFLPKLGYLDLQNTAVTSEAIAAFQKRHPQCFIKD